jgi:hypothetical protein
VFAVAVIVIPIALSIIVAGCDPIAHEQVTVQLPSAGTNAAESAIELIREVVATNGFDSVINTSGLSNQDIIAGFSGPGQACCIVYRRSNEIQVEMNEMGKFKSRPQVIKTRDDLKRTLSERFGKDKVSE